MTMETSRPSLLFLLFLLSIPLFCNSANAKRSPRFPSFINARLKVQSSDSGSGLYKKRYFTQILDHFDFTPQSYETFQQRYLVNDTHWGGKASPIFVYTGNEGDITWFAQNAGFLYETAPLFKALLVFIEHRYYGESIPYGSTDIAYNNATTFGHLSTTQALADYATLILDLKKNLSSEGSPVVVFGGSYGGMLAAWFRLKYPHITIGALASSAPILQFDDLVSPYTFYDIITKDFRSESENCYKVIKNSWKEIKDIASQHGGLDKIQESFKLCDKAEGLGVEDWIANAVVYAAMTDYPTASNFLTPLPAYPVKQMCNAINNPTAGNDVLTRLYGAMNIYYNHSGTEKCFYTGGSDDHGMADGWYWQSCTEMILPTGASNNESIFPPNRYDYNSDAVYCQEYYRVPPRRYWITTEFGGHHIRRVLKRFGSNIIFFNGLRDPWSGGGVLKSLSKSLIAIVAPEGAHHVDLRFSTKEDPKWLTRIRKKEVKIIATWLRQYYIDSRST